MSFGGVIKLQGESEYRRALNNIKSDLGAMGVELKAVTSQFDKNDQSQSAVSAKTTALNALLEKQKERLSLVSRQYQLYSAEVQKSAQEHAQLGKQLEEAKAKLEEIKNTSGEASDEYEEQKAVVEKLTNEYNESTKAQDTNKQSLNNLKKEMGYAQVDVNKTAKEIESLGDESKDTSKQTDNLGDSVEDAGNKASGSSEGFTVFKGALANLVSDGIQKAVQGLKDLGKQTFDAGANFQSAMSQVSAISGATGDDLQQLTDKAKEMGVKTKFTATESAEAFNYMAMAGWKTSDMLNGIEGIMNLAAASGEDLATTSDIVTDALTAMGYSAGDAGELADVMASASANANTNVGLMGATFQYVAPIVGALGYNMQDTAVAIGLMANAGIKGEKAGTALRSMLTRLSAPPKECSEAMDALGISLTDSEGNMKSLDQVMQELRGAFSGLSETQQTQYAKSIAGQEAMSGLLAIVKASPEDFDKLTQAVNNSADSAEDMANTMNDNVLGQLTLLQSKIEGIMINVFDKASGQIKGAINSISETLDTIDWDSVADTIGNVVQKAVEIFQWILDNKDLIISALAGITAGFVAFKTAGTVTSMISGFKKLFDLVKGGQGVMTALNTVMGMNPMSLIVAGIAGLVMAFITLWNTSESFRNFWIGLWENIQSFVGGVVDALAGFFTQTVPNAINTMVQFFSQLPSNISNFLSQVINNVTSWVGNMVNSAVQAGSQFLNNVVNFFSQLPSNVWNWLVNVISEVGSFASQMAQKGLEAGKNLFDNVVNAIASLPSEMLSIGSNIVSGIWDGISGSIQWLKDKITGWVGDVTSFIKNMFGIHSPSTVMRDEVGKYLAKGIGVGFDDEMKDVSQQMADAIPTQFDTDIVAHANPSETVNGYGSNENLISAITEALKGVKIEMDSEEMGHFVDRTVTGLIYN